MRLLVTVRKLLGPLWTGWVSVTASPTSRPRSSAACSARTMPPPARVKAPSLIRGRQTVLAASRSRRWPRSMCRRGRSVIGRTSTGSAAATAGEVDRADHPSVYGLDRGQRRRHPLRVAVQGFVVACRQGAVEGVEDAGQRDEDGDHGGDPEQAHQRPPRCAGDVAEGHLGQARAGKVEPLEQRSEPAAGGAKRADADRGDRRDADGADDGVGGGEERDGEAERGGARVDARQQRRLPDGKRQEILEGAAEDPVEEQSDADTGGDTEQGDLGGEDQRTDRELERGDAQCHPDPISRRCDSTTRLMRLNEAKAAPARSSQAKTLTIRWSLRASSYKIRCASSSALPVIVTPICGSRAARVCRSSRSTRAGSASGASASTSSFTCRGRPLSAGTVFSGA